MNYLYSTTNRVQVKTGGVSILAEGKSAERISAAVCFMLFSIAIAAIIKASK